ncbi:MAG: D-alanyl-D-alanine carboxypeptidase [Clostridiales Family XIII bacterium]|jgi:D-alanyl-D-alanine carboxypeptidase (penicillin-binding protein 5/6)|nr:D-alanyl-D-alanine carboxypeptidase [Clostridiales Family XIII bacterium]
MIQQRCTEIVSSAVCCRGGKSIGRLRRLTAAVVSVLLGFAAFFTGIFPAEPIQAYAADYTQPPVTTGVSVILVDADTGEVLYEKNADEVREPASLTKVMTALVALDQGFPLDSIVTIDQETQYVGEVEIELVEGEVIPFGDLMAAMMVYSANDAAMGIAKAVAPTSEAFEDMMNAKAAELGMANTHFNNPNGLHTDAHYSTARDMAVLTREAMKYDGFRRYSMMPEYTIAATNVHEERRIEARNLLVRDTEATIMVYGERRPVYYDGAIGVKTGFTNEAGNCLIGAAERDGMTVITVVLGSPPPGHQYEDTVSLFEYAFNNFRKTDIFTAEIVGREIDVNKGRENTVALEPKELLTKDLTLAQAESLEYEYDLPESVDAPVGKGVKIGSVKAIANGEAIAETDLVSTIEVPLPPTVWERVSFGNSTAEKILKIAAIAVLSIAFLLLILIARKSIIMRGRRRKRRGRNSMGTRGKVKLYEVRDLGKVGRK